MIINLASLSIYLMLLLMPPSVEYQTSTPTPTVTPDYTYVRDTFPMGLVCSETEVSPGPTWRDLAIGVATLKDFEEQYGKSTKRYDMRLIRDDGWEILLCVKNDIVTAIKVGSDLPYLRDYIALYGIPDAVTYSTVVSRAVFWFEEGIAIDVYINTSYPPLYETVGWVNFFPYQEVEGYETRWPYNRTLKEGIPARDMNVSNAQNPFDFEAIVATMTAQPSWTPTPIPALLSATATLTPIPSYRGITKTRLQFVLIAATMSLTQIKNWLN